MKVLVFGAGVVGSYYAAHLRAAGHQVTVLARGLRLDLHFISSWGMIRPS